MCNNVSLSVFCSLDKYLLDATISSAFLAFFMSFFVSSSFGVFWFCLVKKKRFSSFVGGG